MRKLACALCALALAAPAAGDPAPKAEALWGSWRLVGLSRTIVGSGETTDAFGKAPQGYITYGPDGRMMVLIVKSGRTRPADMAKVTDAQRAELFQSMIAYAGSYTFDGEAVTHHIDVSANENWTGSHQVRHVKIAGGKLVLTTDPQPNSYDGKVGVTVLTWERVSPRK